MMKTLLVIGILTLWTSVQAIEPLDINIDENVDYPQNILDKLESLAKRTHNEKRATADPSNFGANIVANLQGSHVQKRLRPGAPSFTDACGKVTSVPSKYTKEETFMQRIDPTFFKKFAHAYDIPVVGSGKVSDSGIRRMCYMVKYFLSQRYDMRQACYNFWVRFVVIAKTEDVSDIPILRDMGSSDGKSKGFGPTVARPVVACGDENLVCDLSDAWGMEDICTHEVGHMLMRFGEFVIPSLVSRIESAYATQVTKKGKFFNTYAGRNAKEYMASLMQLYLECNKAPEYSKLNVYSRAALRNYDPVGVKLVEELIPCTAKGEHNYIDRCAWKNNGQCENNFQLVCDSGMKAQSSCDVVASAEYSSNMKSQCMKLACTHRAKLIMFRGINCKVLACNNGEVYDGIYIHPKGLGYDIYKNSGSLSELDLVEETKQNLDAMCTVKKSSCSVSKLSKAGPSGISQAQCLAAGYCWKKTKSVCYFPNQDASDKTCDCDIMSTRGDCTVNMPFMAIKCANTCGHSAKIKYINREEVKNMCQDHEMNCPDWLAKKTCGSSLMKDSCPRLCKLCKQVTSIAGL